MGAEEYVVEGLEDGGVALVHEPCNGSAGEGGCSCCTGNAVTLADLINASEQHSCEEEPI